jgi:signal transduction histidine kinase
LLDEEHFQRVLINLVKNAIEASSVGGEVEIAITRLPAGRDWIRVTVSDKGSGVREAHLDKLFKPFFTTKSNGIGLGLANVKKIVSLHGGKVYAKSRSGGGTDFTVELPLRSK